MNFNTAFDNTLNQNTTAHLVQGENGANAYSSLNPINVFNMEQEKSDEYFNNLLIELFLLMRGDNSVVEKLNNIFKFIETTEHNKKECIVKLIKTALFMRNPRKGKGEKKLFYDIVVYMWNKNQPVAKLIIDLTPEFGYWDDINHYYKIGNTEMNDYLVEFMSTQIVNDYKKLIDSNIPVDKKNISLVGKWAPREQSQFKDFFKNLSHDVCKNLYPELKENKNRVYKEYRKVVVSLNKHLNTVQTYMCQKHWADIKFDNVPSVSMTQLSKAFQDEKQSSYPKSSRKTVTKRGKRVIPTDTRRHHSGDADYEDRNKCRENLIEHIRHGEKINSSVANLSDIVQTYLNDSCEDIVYEAQWVSRVNEIKEMVRQLPENPSIFPMVDLSSSMNGDPMINAITLGLFTSMILDTNETENEFCNRFLTFNSKPELIKLPRNGTLKEKMEVMKYWMERGRWGGNTDIQLAIRTLLNIGKQNNIPQEKMPKILAIFSDMQFDQGDSKWNETSYDMIKRDFESYGYTIPHIIFWNLDSNTSGYQVLTKTPNTTMLSGYSTRMMDLFLSGNVEELKETANITPEQKQKNTTLELFQKALNHEMFEKYNDKINKFVEEHL